MKSTAKISTCLWFDKNAEEAANYYVDIFEGKILRKTYYGKEGHEVHGMPEGELLTVEYEILGSKYVNLNGGKQPFQFNESISIIVNCKNQEEVDYYWDKLTAGGDPKAQMCGWLKDKYGLSWQVAPTVLDDMLADPDKEKAGRAMDAMVKMKKIIIKDLEEAFEG